MTVIVTLVNIIYIHICVSDVYIGKYIDCYSMVFTENIPIVRPRSPFHFLALFPAHHTQFIVE